MPNVCTVAGKCESIKECISNPIVDATHPVTIDACLCGTKECGVGNICEFTAGTSGLPVVPDKYLCKCSTDAKLLNVSKDGCDCNGILCGTPLTSGSC